MSWLSIVKRQNCELSHDDTSDGFRLGVRYTPKENMVGNFEICEVPTNSSLSTSVRNMNPTENLEVKTDADEVRRIPIDLPIASSYCIVELGHMGQRVFRSSTGKICIISDRIVCRSLNSG